MVGLARRMLTYDSTRHHGAEVAMSTYLSSMTRTSAHGETLPRSGPIFVAGDGSTSWRGALAVARELARRLGTSLEIVSVVEPTNVIVPPLRSQPRPFHPGANRIQARRERLRVLSADTSDVGGIEPPCSTRILLGDPPSSIARAAQAHGARLIVTGRVPHGMLERAMRRETPLATARAGRVPVLSVSAGSTQLPRRIVVAVSEGDAGARLGSIASALFGQALVLHCVAVIPLNPTPWESESRAEEDERWHEARRALARATAAWALPADVPIETHVLSGERGATLAAFVETSGADLLVIGQPRPVRALHVPRADLATRLFRTVSCATLIVPEVGHTGVGLHAVTAISLTALDWPALVSAFSRRNAGRTASLTVEETGNPVRALVDAWSLSGVDCDPSASAIIITLADPSDLTHHFSHLVARPTVLAVHDAEPGRDELLVIGYSGGQITLALS